MHSDTLNRVIDSVRKLYDTQQLAPEVVSGYKIVQSALFEDKRGISLAHCPSAPSTYVTWQFKDDGEGRRGYDWGHYFSDAESAYNDFRTRVENYKEMWNVRELSETASVADALNAKPMPGTERKTTKKSKTAEPER
jgi:hypothetical protein